MLLGRVLPLQVESRADERAEVTYRTVEEVRHELEERGHYTRCDQKNTAPAA
jgi:hypothetical protein